MKKIIAIALTLVLLCSAVSVFADSVPSKTTDDLVAIEITVENPVDGKAPAAAASTDLGVLAAAAEVAKLAEVGADEYFGAEAAAAVAAIVGEGANVDEFLPITVTDYVEGMGDATWIVKFATPYAEGQVVTILIGMPMEDGQLAWNVYEGVGLADGSVQFTVPGDVMVALVNGSALLAVCSL